MVKHSSAKHEQGQVLVLLVAALVVLLGFTALAVDGSMVYSDRRFTQSVADAAALAGGREAAQYAKEHNITASTLNCSSSALRNAVIAASQSSAAINDISIDANLANNNGVEMYCEDDAIIVRTKVTHVTETNFAHFVFGNSLTNTVEAKVKLQLGDSGTQAAAGGIGLLALSPHGNGALKMTGSGRLGVQNGGIYVNSDHNTAMQVTGSGTQVGKTISVVGGSIQTASGKIEASDVVSIGKNSENTGSGDFRATNGINVNGNLSLSGSGGVRSASIFVNGNLSLSGSGSVRATSTLFVNGTVSDSGSGTISPAPVSTGAPLPVNPMPDPLASIVIPVPGPKPAGPCINFVHNDSISRTLDPGLYCRITMSGSGNLTLNPGLYWIEGTNGFNVSGSGSVTVGPGSTFYIENGPFLMTGSGGFTAPNVFFYLGPQAKAFSLSGSGSLNVSAQTSGPYKGLTLYAKTGTDLVSLTGSGSVSSLNGTFYVPTRPVTLTGSGGTTVFNAQIICDTATLTGSGNLNLVYDGNAVYQIESSGDILLSLIE